MMDLPVADVVQALRERERALAEAQRLAGLGSWEWDPATDTVTWSAAIASSGLGIVSMQERLKLVHGELTIDTKVGHGTRIQARVARQA